jgi:hypothetical protein
VKALATKSEALLKRLELNLLTKMAAGWASGYASVRNENTASNKTPPGGTEFVRRVRVAPQSHAKTGGNTTTHHLVNCPPMCEAPWAVCRFAKSGNPRPSRRARDQRDGHADRARSVPVSRFKRVRPGRSDDPENLGKPPGYSASRAMVLRKLIHAAQRGAGPRRRARQPPGKLACAAVGRQRLSIDRPLSTAAYHCHRTRHPWRHG